MVHESRADYECDSLMMFPSIYTLPQFHYNLGMTLYTNTKGQDVDDIVFSIADQINYGIDQVHSQIQETKLDIAQLNEKAATKAVDCLDFSSALTYLTAALPLLPSDYWTSHYDISLRMSYLLAKAYYSCGDVEKSQGILQDMVAKGHCIEDKLPAYFLLVTSECLHELE